MTSLMSLASFVIKFTRLDFEKGMLNCSASLAMSTRILKALPSKHGIKRYSPSILYLKKNIFVVIRKDHKQKTFQTDDLDDLT